LLTSISNDQLRAKTIEFKKQLVDAKADVVKEIESLKEKAEQTSDMDAREDIYVEIDQLEEKILEITENTLNDILPSAFAVVKETARRFTENEFVEVTATEYDRELSATKPHITLEGRRDSEWMAPLFQFHGLTIDCIDNHRPNSESRRKAYNSDIVYGTNNEFGFDYLRDNMSHAPEDLVQRKHNYAIVDEVDSVLVDDARTPLIISGPVPKGDVHEFNELKPRISSLVGEQQKYLTGVLAEAKKLISAGETKEGGFKLLQAFRGIPKNKALIKYLSEEGVKQLLQKTENFYMQDNNREMHKIDADLLYVIEEKNNQIDLTDKGVASVTLVLKVSVFIPLHNY